MSNFQKLLITIVIVLTLMSVVMCSIVFIYLCIETGNVEEALGFAVGMCMCYTPHSFLLSQ
ncbi:hypothetical protein EON63_04695 [archaeon]|nr:MAG: hypothetical protein EON63_04695 [archaeon]